MDRILTANENKLWTSSGGNKTNATLLTFASNLTAPSGIDIIIQNNNTGTMFIKMGTGATGTDFDFILRASLSPNDGTGGILSLTGINLNQTITAFSGAGPLNYTLSFR